jgi:choline dehydrogenase-like flavoprotein
MPYDGDVIVVGGGAGGATFAYACARAGKRVLLLERGGKPTPQDAVHDERATLIEKQPYDDRAAVVNGTAKRLYIGGVLGGGTALYGAALLRPSRDDFHPGRHYGNRIPRAIWDWPITYDDLEPHYAEAERLYGVAGLDSEDLGPLQKPRHGYPRHPLPLHPVNARLISATRARGLRPFRLPLAIDPERCLRCRSCAGFICPTGARSSSTQLLDRAASQGLPLEVMTNVEVQGLVLDGAGHIEGVRLLRRASGQSLVCRARSYALAAGAIGSPVVLLRSGIGGPLVGRHYMMHLSPIVAGVFPGTTGGDETFVKQVGFADYYFGTRGYAHKLGLIQSLPVPGPLMMAKTAPRFLPRRLQHFLRKRMLPMCGIVEDLPDPANRVTCDAAGRPELHHRFGAYDRDRGKLLGRLMVRLFRKAGAWLCVSRPFPSDEHVAHQCGTLRFGTAPEHAVLDRDCRVFRQANLFVVDGSFFPTSLGVGPALTIMANALRVAAIVTREV